jgi:hypothetical protein
MKTCRKCSYYGPDVDFAIGKNMCKPCQRAYWNRWAAENPEKVRALTESDYRRHRERRLATTRVWQDSNKLQVLIYKQLINLAVADERSADQRNKERLRALEYHEQWRDQLSDGYLAHLASKQIGVPTAFIPQALIEAKRAHIEVRRLLKEKRL